jgi:sugar phosphate isomerase/epimerase
MLKKFNRRDFIKHGMLTGTLLSVSPYTTLAAPFKPLPISDDLTVSVFSKHLQFLNFKDMSAAAADVGFDGVELTVRKRGHVLPENVEKDLPKAISAIKESGLMADMIVTGITELNPQTKAILETAASLGVKYYRMGYMRYPETGTIPEALEKFNRQMKELGELNKSLGIQGCYQNHSGLHVGGNIWEVAEILEDTDKDSMGAQYDIRHAVAEGGRSWPNGIRLLKDRITTIVIKDFRWEKIDGKWQIYNTPLGEGMVDFSAYFKILKEYGINVPVTIHFEYNLFGVEHGETEVAKDDRNKVYAAMKKDLRLVRHWWREA